MGRGRDGGTDGGLDEGRDGGKDGEWDEGRDGGTDEEWDEGRNGGTDGEWNEGRDGGTRPTDQLHDGDVVQGKKRCTETDGGMGKRE